MLVTEDLLGIMLRDNVMAGISSQMKGYKDYTGISVPPCGEFAAKSASIEPPPWVPAQASLGAFQRLLLHREMEHFMAYMRPTTKEVILRQYITSRITRLVADLDPNASVRVVGLTAAGLDFPTSGIEMTIAFGTPDASSTRSSSTRERLAGLEYQIRRSGFASKIDSVLQATVPLLRITDATTGIAVDIKASDDHGVRVSNCIHAWLDSGSDDSTVIECLFMVIKLFLATRRLGGTYAGGINAYTLVWMVVAWVKLELPKVVPGRRWNRGSNSELVIPEVNRDGSASSDSLRGADPTDLGFALKSFLKFYGEDLDMTTAVIRFSSTGVTYTVKPYPQSHPKTPPRYLLSLIDPADSSIDLGSKAYAIKHVQASFREAYHTLTSLEDGTASRSHLVRARMQGTLGCVLGGDYSTFSAKRKRIVERWRKKRVHDGYL